MDARTKFIHALAIAYSVCGALALQWANVSRSSIDTVETSSMNRSSSAASQLTLVNAILSSAYCYALGGRNVCDRNYEARRCIDGSKLTYCVSGKEASPWLSVEIEQRSTVSSVQILNRQDADQNRLGKYEIWVGDVQGQTEAPSCLCAKYTGGNNYNLQYMDECANLVGRFVTVKQETRIWDTHLNLALIKVFGSPDAEEGPLICPSPTPSPTHSPTESPTTPSPTESPTESTVPGLEQADAYAHEDPHLMNIRGEIFDVWHLGQVEFLRIPFEASHGSADFILSAVIRKIASDWELTACKSPYITEATLSGHLLSAPLTIRAESPGRSRVFLGGVALKPSREPAYVGNMSTKPVVLKKADEKSQLNGRIYEADDIVEVLVGGARIQFTAGKAHLNILANNLQAFGKRIGGLLGEDDHAQIGNPPESCAVDQKRRRQQHSLLATDPLQGVLASYS